VSAKKITTEKSQTSKKKAEAPEKPKAKLLSKTPFTPVPAPTPVAPAVAEKPQKEKSVSKEKVSSAAEKKPAAKKTSVKAQAEKPAAVPQSDLKKKAEVKPVAAPAKVVQRASLASLFGVPASSEETVFSEEPPEWVKPEWIKYYRNLYGLRKRLKDQMLGLAEHSAQEISSFGMHMADAGTDHFDRDFALSQLSADRDAIYEVEQALKRIQKGTFGVCEMTGKPIPKNRLEAIPWTRYTVEAQAIIEKEGGKNRRRLGDLGNLTSSSGDESESRSSAEEDDEGEDKLA